MYAVGCTQRIYAGGENIIFIRSQGWGNPLSYSEISPLDPTVKWSISLVDESGKVPISTIAEKDLVSLFCGYACGGVIPW